MGGGRGTGAGRCRPGPWRASQSLGEGFWTSEEAQGRFRFAGLSRELGEGGGTSLAPTPNDLVGWLTTGAGIP